MSFTELTAAEAASGVRVATSADIDVVAETLADAFTDYSWTRWALPADSYQDRLRAMQRYFTERVGLPYGRVHIVDGGTAAAVWTLPDTAIDPQVFVAPELLELYGERLSAGAEADAVLAGHRPDRPCWFLATVGVRGRDQGKGLGSRVLAPGLRAARESGHAAFLETSERRNVDFYERLGFTVTAEVDLPGDAPRTWCMLRE
ncbi:GNAT family N-acetyltransferase [Nocardiopsis ansamitocini]|uniref:N-acetyltransferase n=1 Tax=Nocardiopsis ansamitocini TaxID=1670832 RepID=A0A9W6P4P6_9ACTN|nr:GNAT family N-acetyltransferase [Nocardiopsis ansamitocini]GLU47052.1 N-acetyltransferase [Nocardiopsis ansamitocini]